MNDKTIQSSAVNIYTAYLALSSPIYIYILPHTMHLSVLYYSQNVVMIIFPNSFNNLVFVCNRTVFI
jgi:hypothetical protein